MPDRVDAAMKSVEPSAPQAVANRVPAQTEIDQLRAGDYAVLPRRQRGHLDVDRTR
jgi:hypothetical protein